MTLVASQGPSRPVRTAPWLAAAACVCLGLAPGAARPSGAETGRPNILFILADDVGQEVLGSYGGESYATPHLDQLAREGMRFHHAYSMPSCHPTRLALMTGRYPFRQGGVAWGSFPPGEEPWTFANLLAAGGYATAVAGKWQLALLRDDRHHPRRLGFQSWDLFGWHEGPRYYEPMVYRDGIVRTDTLGHYGPDLYLRSLIDFMSANRDRPFLAFYSMALCHDVTDDLDEPVPHGPFDRYDSYPEMVAEMDRNVGRLLAALEALDLSERTLVLFVGDNGTPQQMIVRAEGTRLVKEPVVSLRSGREVPGGKGTLSDRGTRVPLIARWPGTIEPGREVDDLVDFTDFLPTFRELAGVALPEGRALDGSSFAALLRGEGRSGRSWVYAEESVLPLPGSVEPSRASSGGRWVRDASWKLYADGRLYDMRQDPSEERPIGEDADSAASREARARLEAALNELGRS